MEAPVATASTVAVRIGVAGWDYPDWRGRVYPARVSPGFDRLAWVAEFVDLVEVNASFYRPVVPRHAEGWIRTVADRPRFRFTAKAHRSWTHDPDTDLDRAVHETLDGLAPLREAGILEAVLVQFPQRFHAGPRADARLEAIADRTRGWPVVVEVRHRSWERPEARERLRGLGLGWCVVDQPRVGGAAEPIEVTTSGLAYVRLHGRNVGAWFRADAGRDERYDDRYTRPELREVAACVRRLAASADSVVVVHNNHFRGQSMVNALQLRALLETGRPRAPDSLMTAFPDLRAECVTEQERLF